MGEGLLRRDKEYHKEIIEVMSYAVQYSSSWTKNSDQELKRRSFELEKFALYQMVYGSECYCETPLANEIHKYKEDLPSLVAAIQKDEDLYQKAIFALEKFMDWLEYQELSHPEYRECISTELKNLQRYTKEAMKRVERGMNDFDPEIKKLVKTHKKGSDWDDKIFELIDSMSSTTQEGKVNLFCCSYGAPQSLISAYKSYCCRPVVNGKSEVPQLQTG